MTDDVPAAVLSAALLARPGLSHVDHVAIAVIDVDVSTGHYHRLGLRVVHDERLTDVGVRLVYLAAVGPGGRADHSSAPTMIQLVQPIGAGAVADWVALHGEGLHHVCLAVDDVPRFCADVADVSDGDSIIFRGGRDRRACFLAEQPNGVLIELTDAQPHKPYLDTLVDG